MLCYELSVGRKLQTKLQAREVGRDYLKILQTIIFLKIVSMHFVLFYLFVALDRSYLIYVKKEDLIRKHQVQLFPFY